MGKFPFYFAGNNCDTFFFESSETHKKSKSNLVPPFAPGCTKNSQLSRLLFLYPPYIGGKNKNSVFL